MAELGRAVVSLPFGQVPELWKTLLYHLRSDRGSEAALRVVGGAFPGRTGPGSSCQSQLSVFVELLVVRVNQHATGKCS